MRGTVLYDSKDVRFEEVPEPKIDKPTDAIIRMAATCVCGSDLWPYRGVNPLSGPTPMGHEYCRFVEEVGSAVTTVAPGNSWSARSQCLTTLALIADSDIKHHVSSASG